MGKATAKISLSGVEKGQRLTFSTVAAINSGNSGTFTLSDGATVYGTLKKTSSSQAALGQVSEVYKGSGSLTLDISVEHGYISTSVNPLISISKLADSTGKVVATVWTIAIEDCLSEKSDYNDYVITVIATNKT